MIKKILFQGIWM